MANENFIERLSSNFSQSASVKNIFGEPVQVQNKTIIPVAQFAYGFGGGFGQGGKKFKRGMQASADTQDGEPTGEGAGGGGGIRATAKGVFEITPTATRFIPANSYRHIATGILIGLCAKVLFGRCKRKRW